MKTIVKIQEYACYIMAIAGCSMYWLVEPKPHVFLFSGILALLGYLQRKLDD